ncbi:Mitogen-activated protein kinase-binding protein 1 [Colletotrichum siamense]|nr:Mitogen-activated protein kinase-binding protein 1 [Colletotrichum siamense]
MSATPQNRLKLTPGNSPYLQRPPRSPLRGRLPHESRLSLKRVVGTTCASPTGFDTVNSSFAYIAGGAVVVVDVDGEQYAQRFYRARPTASAVHGCTPLSHGSPSSSTPKANDSRNRVAREPADWSVSPTSSNTWTSRERIKAATCLALSRDGRYLAVGETGYAPRVLIFNLEDSSSDVPLVSISEHGFGVNAVAWSSDTRWLASLGASTDGFLFIWRIDPRTGAAKLYQQNKCTSTIKGMVWMGNNLVTLGVRHIKIWRVEEASTSPLKTKFSEVSSTPQPPQKTLNGRNVLLGSLLEATFTCAAVVDETNIIICSEAGDICMVEDDGKQSKLVRSFNVDFPVTSITIRHATAYVSGKGGEFATLGIRAVLDSLPDAVLSKSTAPAGLTAMGFLTENLVTIDEKHSIDIWSSSYLPGQTEEDPSHIPIPGHQDPILGIQAMPKPNDQGADFFTWSASGTVIFWDMKGKVKFSLEVPIEQVIPEVGMDPVGNQLSVVRASRAGKMLAAADRFGVLRIIDLATQECLLETKAHSSDCQNISIYEDDSKFLLATCGRDRTAQLFHRLSTGEFQHVQTLEFAAKVVQTLIPSEDRILTCSMDRTLQIHDIVCKEGEPEEIAALSARTVTLKASPTSFALSQDERTAFVSMLDRSICHYDLSSGKLLNSFKCLDEGQSETAIMDSLIYSQSSGKDGNFLLGISNTDKSVRVYDAQSGHFLDREWGHTESISGVALTEDDDGNQRVISVGLDGTVMVWGMEEDASPASGSRDPSPMKDASTSSRPPLRRVLSKAELAEFQRPSSANGGRRSPRSVQRRTSRYALNTSVSTPKGAANSPSIAEDTPSRRSSGSGSPPVSPKSRASRRPSLPSLGLPPKKSSPNLRGFGSLGMATEQACRTLRAYRKKLSSTEPLSQDSLTELDQELRMTAAALGDRAIRTHDTALISGLLDQYEERLASMLDEKLRRTFQDKEIRDVQTPTEEREIEMVLDRPSTAGGETISTASLS